MPFTVQELLGDRSPPTIARADEPVDKALAKMREYDFSQLPVVADDGRPIGILTNNSILRMLSFLDTKMSDLRVDDAMDRKFAAYEADEDLFDLLDDLGNTYAVLIVDGEGRLTGIITSFDTTEFFRNRYDAMMLVEDIEGMLKELIRTAFSNKEGEVDEVSLGKLISGVAGDWNKRRKLTKSVIARYLNITAQPNGSKFDESKFQDAFIKECPPEENKALDTLTFNDFIQLLTDDETWKRLDGCLGPEPSAIRGMLTSVRNTRNDLAHFRGVPSVHDHERLKFCNERLDRARSRLAKRIPENAPSSQVPAAPSAALPVVLEQVDPGAEMVQPGDSRYSRLALHLQGLSPDTESLSLSFSQVEQIIGGRIPHSARAHRAWWANDTRSHVQSRQWLDAGWRVSLVSIDEGRVTFVRIRERAQLYARFYSELIAALRKQANFQMRSARGSGMSWVWVADLPEGRAAAAHLAFSFALRDRFRVELYIDNGNAGDNKSLFDNLLAQRESMEAEIGMVLSWERLNDRRASRIAAYHPGAITDAPQQLESLKAWAVEKMIRFHRAIEPRVR